MSTFAKQFASGLRHVNHLSLSTLRKVFSLMGRREKIALLVMLALALVSAFVSFNSFYIAHTKAVPGNGGDYSEGIIGTPRLINPLLATSSTDEALVHLVFSGLYKYDASDNLVPDLAASMPEIDKTQKVYTVHLRKNAKWQNDQNFTADDVIFTIQTIQDARYNSPLRSQWLNTVVSKTDDYTLVFTIKDISGPFQDNLALPIINKSIWQKVLPENFLLSQNNLEAVGTGPYTIKEIKKLPQGTVQNIKLEAFNNYAGGRPHLNTVSLVFYNNYDDVLHGLHGKQIDGFGFVPFDQNLYLDRANKNLNVLSLPLPEYQAVFFNLSDKLFADKNVRKAFGLATDKQKIISDVFSDNARLIGGPILPEQVSGLPAATNNFNVDQARAMLDAAGWKINPQTNLRAKGSQTLEFTLATNDFALNAKTAEMLAAQWGQLNVKVNLNILPTMELTNTIIRPRKFDVLLFAQKLGADPDPFIFWHSSQSKNPGLNLPGFNNATADKLISQARNTTDTNMRDALYRQFQTLITDESPAIFLNQSVFIYALDHSIRGVGLQNLYDPTFRFYDLPNWYLDERRVWK